MHPVPVMVLQRARGKVRPQAVLRGDGPHHGAEHHGVVRGSQGVGVAEVDLVLSRPAFVVGALRENAHALQRQADLPADVLSFVLRRHVHIARLVEGFLGGLALLVQTEKVKLHLRTEAEFITLCRGVRHGPAQKGAGVSVKGRAVRVDDVAEHMRHPPALGAPGQLLQRVGVGAQEKVAALVHVKAADGGGVKGDAVVEGAGQLPRHDRHVALLAVNVAERHADELDVLLQNILHHFIAGVFHVMFAPSVSGIWFLLCVF